MHDGRDNTRLGDHPAPGFDGSTQALLSALIRELSDWSVRERAGARTLELPLPSQDAVIEAPLREPIGVGRIAVGPARLRDASGQLHPLRFDELVTRLVAEPSIARAIGLERAPTWLVGLASSFGPAVTILVAVGFLGERLRPIQWLGLGGIGLGLVAIAIP